MDVYLLKFTLLSLFATSISQSIDVNVKAGIVSIVNVTCDDVTTVTVTDVPNTGFILFEAHSQWYNLTVSNFPRLVHGRYENGTHIGMIFELLAQQTSVVCHLQCQNQSDSKLLNVVIKSTIYDVQDPIPGGCNQEYPLPEDPNIHIRTALYTNVVAFQYANLGHISRLPKPECEIPDNSKNLTYRVFAHHLHEGDIREVEYLNALIRVLNGSDDDLTSFGIEAMRLPGIGRTEVMSASYARQGVIYTVVVEQDIGNGKVRRAVYVPSVWYGSGCGPQDCLHREAVEIAAYSLLFIIGVVSLLIAFAGHRFFQIEMFYFGYLAMMVLLLVVIVKFSHFTLAVSVLMVLGLGLTGGVVWCFFWYMKGIPVVIVLVPGFMLGFLCSCFFFNFTPLVSLSVFKSPLNYGLAVACTILLPTVILLYFTRMLNLLCCAMVGTFLPLYCVSLLLPGVYKHFLMDTFKNVADENYLSAYKYFQLNINDIVLTVLWVILLSSAFIFQTIREQKRPPFPICPYTQYKNRLKAHKELTDQLERPPAPGDTYIVNHPTHSSPAHVGEREPLMRSSGAVATQANYGTSPGRANLLDSAPEVVDPI